MRVSQGFIDHICELEGLRTQVYTDTSGVATIGCGHTGSGVTESPISIERAYELAREDVSSFEGCINRNVTAPLTQSMFDALVSMAYNMGCTGLLRTGVVDLVNAGRYQQAGEKIKTVGLTDRRGVVLRGLVARREIESAMFFNDGIPQSGEPAPSVATAPVRVRVSPSGSFIGSWSWWTALAVVALGATTIVYHRYKKKP